MAIFDRLAKGLARLGLVDAKAAFPSPIPDRVHVTSQWSDEIPGDEIGFQTYANAYSQVAMVYRVVGILAENVASVVPKVYNKDGAEQTDHELTKLLHYVNPRDWTWSLLHSTMVNMSLGGEAFWQLAKGKTTGRIMEIWNRRPDKVSIRKGNRMYREVEGYTYWASPTAEPVSFEVDEVVHHKYPNPLDEYRGLRPIQAAREGILIDIYVHTDRKGFFKNSARPSAVMETDELIAEPTIERLRAEFEDMHKGVGKAYKTAVLDQGLKLKPWAISPADAQWLEQMKLSWQEIAIIFGVPPVLVGMWEAANYATAVQAKKSFWEETVIPNLKLLSGAMNEFLCPHFKGDVRVDWDLSEVPALQESEQDRWTRYKEMLERGAVTINEVREWLRLGDDLPWGNTYYLPLTMVPIGATRPEEEAPRAEILPGPEWKVLTPPRRKVIEFGSEEHERLWKLLLARIDPREKAMMRQLRQDFTQQERGVKSKLSQLQGYEPETEAVKQTSPDDLAVLILFDLDSEIKRFGKIYGPRITEALEAAGIAAISDLAITVDFSIELPEVVAWLENKTFNLAREVNETTLDKLRAELVEGFTQREGIPQIEERIGKVFDMRRGYETERIARTEIIGASNQGSLQAYKQSGVVHKKSWLAAMDERTRPTHGDAHMRYQADPIPIDAKFIVGNSEMDAPGDPSASAEEIVNCRCGIQPVVEV